MTKYFAPSATPTAAIAQAISLGDIPCAVELYLCSVSAPTVKVVTTGLLGFMSSPSGVQTVVAVVPMPVAVGNYVVHVDVYLGCTVSGGVYSGGTLAKSAVGGENIIIVDVGTPTITWT